jgi:hypothetical protein
MAEAGHEPIVNTRYAPRRPDPMHACVKIAHERQKHATVAAGGIRRAASRSLALAVCYQAMPRQYPAPVTCTCEMTEHHPP